MLGVQTCALPDRKSTRLNSSHTLISYAVFCLKKNHEEDDDSARGCRAGGHTRLPGRPRLHAGRGPPLIFLSVTSSNWPPSEVLCFFFKVRAPPKTHPLPLPAPLPI